MRNVDFLFIYEVKNREIESLCLLKYEMENRGYSVGIINTWQYLYKKKPEYYAKVIVVFALYNNATYDFVKQYVKGFEKIINLQWEQIFNNEDEKNRCAFYFLKDIAKKCVHISWGARNYDRLVNFCDIPEYNVKIGGNVSLDFLRPEFKGYYKNRINLLHQYKMSPEKRVYLFISSFAYAYLPEEDIQKANGSKNNFSTLKEISSRSEKYILVWIRNILENDKNCYFIYRPHPAELKNNNLLNKMKKKYQNFLVIDEYSVKQWIMIADKIYTWYSTSIVEIFMAKKSCNIIRPIPIPHELDMPIYENANIINSYKEFKKSFYNKNRFPITEELIKSIYDINEDIPSYIKVCNIMSEVYYDKRYLIKNVNFNDIKDNTGTNLFYSVIMNEYIVKFLIVISKKSHLLRKCDFIKKVIYHKDMITKNSISDKEIELITKRIKHVLKD
jgi:hypothetical protein